MYNPIKIRLLQTGGIMGERDKRLKVYLDDSRRYADMINAGIFGGKQMVLPEDLIPEKTVSTKVVPNGTKEKISDLAMKQCKNGEKYAIWLLENQNTIDYSMPIRVMLKEALEYDEQLAQIKKKNNRENKLLNNDSEFLCKMKKTDKLYPVHTLIVYWGKERWDGPRSLHDILHFVCDNSEDLEYLKRITPEYPLLLLDLSEKKDYSEFQTELKTVFELYALRDNKSGFKKYLAEHEVCKHLDDETYRIIGEMTNEKRLLDKMQQWTKIENGKEKGENNMCKAIDDMIEDAREEGKYDTIKILIKREAISISVAAEVLGVTEEELKQNI